MKAPKQFCHKAIKWTRHQEDTNAVLPVLQSTEERASSSTKVVLPQSNREKSSVRHQWRKRNCHHDVTKAVLPQSNREKSSSSTHNSSATKPYLEIVIKRHQSSSAIDQDKEIETMKAPSSSPPMKIKKLSSWRHLSSSATKQQKEIVIEKTHFCHKAI